MFNLYKPEVRYPNTNEMSQSQNLIEIDKLVEFGHPMLFSMLGNLTCVQLFEVNPVILNNTEHLLSSLKVELDSNGYEFEIALLNIDNCNFDDQVTLVFEWWNDSRKLTLYADLTEVYFIKVWGADMDNEMEDGEFNVKDVHKLFELYGWLFDL